MPQLGGRRPKSKTGSIHTAWTVDAFRAYADYADAPEFESALDELIEFAKKKPSAFMCAEGLWWQCHRRIISDHLVLRGFEVFHMMPDGKLVEHRLPDFATIVSGKIAYNGEKTG